MKPRREFRQARKRVCVTKPSMPVILQHVNRIQVVLMSETVYALVDTGASVSCNSEDLYHQLGLNQEYPLQPPNIPTIHGVSNRPMPV